MGNDAIAENEIAELENAARFRFLAYIGVAVGLVTAFPLSIMQSSPNPGVTWLLVGLGMLLFSGSLLVALRCERAAKTARALRARRAA